MTGAELKAVQEAMGWDNKQAAEILAHALDRKYTNSTISRWRNDREAIPAHVAAFLAELAVPADDSEHESSPGVTPPSAPGEDTPPPPPTVKPQPAILSAGGTYAAVCEQFFELIATAVGMIGAAIGNEAVKNDGAIILADKRELGKAWGKLAEQNEVFRNMILSADKQGAYLSVALVTGTTAGRIWQNHQRPIVTTYTETDGLRVVSGTAPEDAAAS